MTGGWQQANRESWEHRARLHARDETGFYNVAGFLAGEDKLGPIESSEIGDVRGRRVLHLQCHFGLDTLSLARRGAEVTGLDSPKPRLPPRGSSRRKSASRQPSSKRTCTTPAKASTACSTLSS